MRKGINWIKQAKASFDQRKKNNKAPPPPRQEPMFLLKERLEKAKRLKSTELATDVLDKLWKQDVRHDGLIRQAQEFLREMSQQKPQTMSR